MKIEERYISDKNIKKLMSEVLLSVKSSNVKITNNEETKEKSGLLVHNISAKKRTPNAEYEISIKKWDVISWFRRLPEFLIEVKYWKGYDDVYIKIDVPVRNENHSIVNSIYNHLTNLDENNKIDEVNSKLENIISDISTSVDKKYRRDDTINEILN